MDWEEYHGVGDICTLQSDKVIKEHWHHRDKVTSQSVKVLKTHCHYRLRSTFPGGRQLDYKERSLESEVEHFPPQYIYFEYTDEAIASDISHYNGNKGEERVSYANCCEFAEDLE